MTPFMCFSSMAIILGIFLFCRWIATDQPSPAYQQLRRMPSDTVVVPIMTYTGYGNKRGHLVNTSEAVDYPLYEWVEDAPAMTAGQLASQLSKSARHNLQATPIASVKQFNRTIEKSQGKYGTPEYAVDGTITGYKWLARTADGELFSPRGDLWVDGHLKADAPPMHYNRNGIHFGYSPESDVLRDYEDYDVLAAIQFQGRYELGDESGRAEEGDISQIIYEKPPKDGDSPLKFWTHWKNREEE